MEKHIKDLEKELKKTKEDKSRTESQMQDLRDEIEKLKIQVAWQQLPWWKRMFGNPKKE